MDDVPAGVVVTRKVLEDLHITYDEDGRAWVDALLDTGEWSLKAFGPLVTEFPKIHPTKRFAHIQRELP